MAFLEWLFVRKDNKPVPKRKRSGTDPSQEQLVLEYNLSRVCPDLDVWENYKDPKWHLPRGMDVDIYLPDENIAIEYDSYKYHRDRTHQEIRKNMALHDAGVEVVRVRDRRLAYIGLTDEEFLFYNNDVSKSEAMQEAVDYISVRHDMTHQNIAENSWIPRKRRWSRDALDNMKRPKVNVASERAYMRRANPGKAKRKYGGRW